MKMKLIPLTAIAAFLPAMAFTQDAPAESDASPEEIVETVLMVDVDQEGFVPFKCPIEKIRSAYQNLVDPEDTLVALAIEKQTLAICRQSQEALIRIAENEVRLKELFEPIIAPPPPPPAPEPEPEPEQAPEPEPIIEEVFEPMDLEPVEPPEPEFVPPSYAVAAIMKDPIGWKAMIVDGGAIYTVREGDRMDDGSTIISIKHGQVELLSEDNFSFFLE